jgi:hypothetical protein
MTEIDKVIEEPGERWPFDRQRERCAASSLTSAQPR